MKVFITGATGFIGSHVARRLVSEGHEVHIYTRENSSLWRLADCEGALVRHVGDITDPKAVQDALRAAKPEVVLHLANSGVYGGVAAPSEENYKVNVFGILNLLEALEEHPAALFINFGSSSEYGRKDVPMREDEICIPMSHYAIAKVAATNLTTYWAQSKNRSAVTLRIFSPYGPWDEGTRLIPQSIRAFSRGEECKRPHPKAVRDYIYIDDVVDAIHCVIFSSHHWQGDSINIGSGTQTYAKDVVTQIAALLGKEDMSSMQDTGTLAFTESPMWVADISKAKTLLNWQPVYTLERGLQETVAWFNQHGHVYDNNR